MKEKRQPHCHAAFPHIVNSFVWTHEGSRIGSGGRGYRRTAAATMAALATAEINGNLIIGGSLAPLRALKKRPAGWSPTEEIGWSRTQEIRWSSIEETGWSPTEEILHMSRKRRFQITLSLHHVLNRMRRFRRIAEFPPWKPIFGFL
jgi:hypothetical protein